MALKLCIQDGYITKILQIMTLDDLGLFDSKSNFNCFLVLSMDKYYRI